MGEARVTIPRSSRTYQCQNGSGVLSLNILSPTGGAMMSTMRNVKRDIVMMATVVVATVLVKKDCPKISLVSAIKRNDESEEAEPVERKTSRVNLMVLIPKKNNDNEGLMFVDINVVGEKKSALVDTEASDLSSPKCGARNQRMESNEEFEVGTKVLSSIQLVEDVLYGKNIDSIERDTTKAPSKVLVVQEIDMKLAESTMEPTPLGKGRLLANEMYQRVEHFKLRGDRSRGKDFEGRDNLIVRQVENKPRQQESSKVNQVSAIQKSQQGRCKNGWGRMSRAKVQYP
ncbi:hypothetical protein J1N35_039019 [Gossypium stocksii]|uniref:Uncharacterized protein n=1 Tax=Gossypium stocksii TaxID=47602 RepID=A0A9D3UN27_9ROSI|nr:hypothetical protein J1N35_039019 [Gossypium stocksii]